MICTTTGSVILPPLLRKASVILVLSSCLDSIGKWVIICKKGSSVRISLISYVISNISVKKILKEAKTVGFKFLILSNKSLNF